jgi:hypothetical protein
LPFKCNLQRYNEDEACKLCGCDDDREAGLCTLESS